MGRGEKSRLRDPGSELRLGKEKETVKTAKMIDGMNIAIKEAQGVTRRFDRCKFRLLFFWMFSNRVPYRMGFSFWWVWLLWLVCWLSVVLEIYFTVLRASGPSHKRTCARIHQTPRMPCFVFFTLFNVSL